MTIRKLPGFQARKAVRILLQELGINYDVAGVVKELASLVKTYYPYPEKQVKFYG